MSENFRLADNEVIDVGNRQAPSLAPLGADPQSRSSCSSFRAHSAFIFPRPGSVPSAFICLLVHLQTQTRFVFGVCGGYRSAVYEALFGYLNGTFASRALEKRTIVVNNQPVQFSPERFVRPASWIIAILFALFYGLAMKGAWQTFALYFNQAQSATLGSNFS